MSDIHAPVSLPEGAPGRGFGGAVFFGLFAVLAVMACLKYLALHSTVFDLGVFLSNLYSLHTYNQWWRAFLGHAQPLLPLYAQIYRLAPDQAAPLALLTAQALVLALPAVWAGRRYGLLAALSYALFYPVWTNALFDFHLDHLLIPILFGFLAAATSGRTLAAFCLGLLPALVKEPYALTTVCCGAYLLLFQRRRRAGWALMILGGLYFYVATTYLVPFCTADGGLGAQSGAYAWLGGSPRAVMATLVGHPFTVLAEVFGVWGKWKYLLFLFGALLFFPLFRPKLLVPALPALALALLSTNPNYYGWANHYTAGAAGALFFAYCEVLGPVRILARQSGVGARPFGLVLLALVGLVHMALAPSPVSRLFWMTDNFAFSMDAYEPTARDAAILGEMLKSVPRDPSVAVVSQNTLNWGALAERLDYNSFPLGVFEPHPVRDLSRATLGDFWTFVRTGQTPNLPVRAWQAQYVILDLTRPWFVLDRGCEFRDGACHDEAVAQQFNALVIRARQELETVYDQGGVLILRRPGAVLPGQTVPQPAPPTAAAPGGESGGTASGTPTPPAATVAPQGPPPATPGQPTTAPASTPAVAPTTDPSAGTPGDASAPAASGDIEVEVLDRFPRNYPAKKGKLAPTAVPAAPAATPAEGAPAENGATVTAPQGEGAPAPETAPKRSRRSRRHATSTETPAATPTPTDGAPVEGSGTVAAPQGEVTPAPETAPKRSRRSRRHATPTETPAATPTPAPTDGAPVEGSGTVAAPQGEVAPAPETAPKRSRRARHHRASPETPASTPVPAEGGTGAPAP